MLKILKLTFWIVFLYIILTYLIHNISAWTKISYVKVYMADILVNLLTNQLPYTVLMTLRPLNLSLIQLDIHQQIGERINQMYYHNSLTVSHSV